MSTVDGSVLESLGWNEALDASFRAHRSLGRLPARVVAVHKETSIVRSDAGDDRAVVSGRFRFDALSTADYPAVGDWVALEAAAELAAEDERVAQAAAGGDAVIAAVLPRQNSFRRSAADASRRGSGRGVDEQVLAANVDVALIVAGLDHDFNPRRIERYLAVARSCGIEPVVVLNKADLEADLDGRRWDIEQVASGVAVVATSARAGTGLDDLGEYLRPGTTAVVLGSSGVGKSTLLNALLGSERQATSEVRDSDSRGRHTTTHRELFLLPTGALLIDTPGIRSLEVAGADEGVEGTFEDVTALAAACRFADCRHAGEPGCAVRAAIDAGTLTEARLESHRKLERESAHAIRKTDPVARSEERKRWKQIHKAVGKHMDQKYGEEWR